jgi:type II secretory pathway pseudopilin PulG
MRLRNGYTLRQPLIRGFSFADLMMVVAVLGALFTFAAIKWSNARDRNRLATCKDRLEQINRAVLTYALDNRERLPEPEPGVLKPHWWWYKEQVKGNLNLRGRSSAADREFACPSDRGYDDDKPLRLSEKSDFSSYTYNGVNLPGLPNISGKNLGTIKEPGRTLLVMEWTAHAPLSWHRSRTGSKNHPFYNNAESVVGFVDGRVEMIPIYYDGINAAYTRDPIPGYDYKYSGD